MMIRFVKYSALVLYVCLLQAVEAKNYDFSLLEKYIKDVKTVSQLPSGTAIAIIEQDKVIYEGYIGYADIVAKKAVDNNTHFYIASVTKSFFALATLLKEHQNQITEDTTLKQLFPELNFKHIDPTTINMRHLLTHTSGLDDSLMTWSTAYSGITSETNRHRIIENLVPHKSYGLNDYQYTNLGYNILSVWFDKQDQQTWKNTLQHSVFSPLGMGQTSAYMSDVADKNWQLAKGYSTKMQDWHQPVYLVKKDNTMHAAGGVISTLPDMAKYILAQINHGMVDGKQAIPADVVNKSHQTQVEYERYGHKRAYAWGWNVRQLFNKKLLEHRGGFAGASAYASFMPSEKIGLVVLTNQDKWGGDLAYSIEDAVYGQLTGQSSEDISQLLSQQLSTVESKVIKQRLKLEEKQQKRRQQKCRLTLPASHYLGSYRHPLLGDIQITQNNAKQLSVRWGSLHSVANGADKVDSIDVEFVPGTDQMIRFEILDDKVIALNYQELTFQKYSVH